MLQKKTSEQEDLEFYIQTIHQYIPELKSKYSINSIGFFGSYVRNEQLETSDIDILVDFEKPIGLFAFIELEIKLSEYLGIKVDLVSKGSLQGRIGQAILSEVVYI